MDRDHALKAITAFEKRLRTKWPKDVKSGQRSLGVEVDADVGH